MKAMGNLWFENGKIGSGCPQDLILFFIEQLLSLLIKINN